MSVQSPLYVTVLVFGLAVLILIIRLGAIVHSLAQSSSWLQSPRRRYGSNGLHAAAGKHE
jgi:hypothetical protein